MGGKNPRALNFNSVVENPDLDVIVQAIVTMKNRVGNDLMYGLCNFRCR